MPASERASLIMHSYLERQRIATQMTTQRSDTIDLYMVFTPIHFMRNGFTVSFVLSPVTGLCCHRRLRKDFRKLDASVGASGPHDFAVRLSAVRQRHRHVHRIPSRVRDDRETPHYRDGTAN
jgi:hypothetical protein